MLGRQRTVTQADGGEQGDPLMPLLPPHWKTENIFVHSWMTFSCCASLTVWSLCSNCSLKSWSGWLESGSTKGRPKCGTRAGQFQKISSNSDVKHGSTKTSKCWGHLLGLWSSLVSFGGPGSTRSGSCGTQFRPCRICSVRASFVVQSANPRANHILRTLPPRFSIDYAQEHDGVLWKHSCMESLERRSREHCARQVPMINERTPTVAIEVQTGRWRKSFHRSVAWQNFMRRVRGWIWKGSGGGPCWQDLREGRRPPAPTTSELGEWQHGWQYWASSVSDSFFRKTTMLSARTAASRAHLRPHSWHNAGAALAHAPTAPEYVIPSHLFRVLVLERLQLPLPVNEALCFGCGCPLDPLGRHRAACPCTGRLKKRAGPIERMLPRVRREAGAGVSFNAFLRDMNLGVSAGVERRIEVLAQDLPCFG